MASSQILNSKYKIAQNELHLLIWPILSSIIAGGGQREWDVQQGFDEL
jgi:hypothetical protein